MVISMVANLYYTDTRIELHHLTCRTSEMRKIATHNLF